MLSSLYKKIYKNARSFVYAMILKKYFLKLGNNVKEISGENIHNEILRLPKEMLENMTLTADEHLEYGYIVEIMSKLRNENVKNVSLNIQKNDK